MIGPLRPSVLVVEDDPDIAELLELHLSDVPCRVDVCRNGVSAFAQLSAAKYDAVILDVALPEMDGLALCHAIRKGQNFVPILFVTARTTETDRVMGLDAGGDDYLTKPFSIRELQARVRALIRRAQHYRGPTEIDSELVFDRLRISPERRTVAIDGRPIDLTAKEFELLIWFARHPGRVFTREQLLNAVWGYTHTGYGHTVNSHINRLRCKLEQHPATPEFILTVWSIGYKFRESGVSA
jgi:DNA-binding response OmpR family regulator